MHVSTDAFVDPTFSDDQTALIARIVEGIRSYANHTCLGNDIQAEFSVDDAGTRFREVALIRH